MASRPALGQDLARELAAPGRRSTEAPALRAHSFRAGRGGQGQSVVDSEARDAAVQLARAPYRCAPTIAAAPLRLAAAVAGLAPSL